jgi:hypothetical protein
MTDTFAELRRETEQRLAAETDAERIASLSRRLDEREALIRRLAQRPNARGSRSEGLGPARDANGH